MSEHMNNVEYVRADRITELERQLGEVRIKHEVACSTLEVVKEQRTAAQKALAEQCKETNRLERQNAELVARLTNGGNDVIAERQRQMSVEGWTPEHDAEHSDRSLAQAAACYLAHYIGRQWVYADGDAEGYQNEEAPYEWPDSWCTTWWKPRSPRRDLVRAAALLIAEIDRIDTTAPQQQSGEKPSCEEAKVQQSKD